MGVKVYDSSYEFLPACRFVLSIPSVQVCLIYHSFLFSSVRHFAFVDTMEGKRCSWVDWIRGYAIISILRFWVVAQRQVSRIHRRFGTHVRSHHLCSRRISCTSVAVSSEITSWPFGFKILIISTYDSSVYIVLCNIQIYKNVTRKNLGNGKPAVCIYIYIYTHTHTHTHTPGCW